MPILFNYRQNTVFCFGLQDAEWIITILLPSSSPICPTIRCLKAHHQFQWYSLTGK